MDQVIINLLKLQLQLKINHWQTNKFSQHEAFGKTYNDLSDLIDNLVEVHQGKYGVISYETPIIELTNLVELDTAAVLNEATDYLSTTFTEMHDSVKDTDCLNIRDEILSVLNKLKYLLTLE